MILMLLFEDWAVYPSENVVEKETTWLATLGLQNNGTSIT